MSQAGQAPSTPLSSHPSGHPSGAASSSAEFADEALRFAASRNLVLITGKGGVGKTTFSQALALALAESKKKVLWIHFDDPNSAPGERYSLTERLQNQLSSPIASLPEVAGYNCEAGAAFSEYIHIKLGKLPMAKLFLANPVIRSLVKASPGIHELVQLGKVWNERKYFDHVVVDLPSTGYAVAMFQSMLNFKNLFKTGPVVRDAEGMLSTFDQHDLTSLFILCLPEEMPIREGIELRGQLQKIFPNNAPYVLCNRILKLPNPASAAAVSRPPALDDSVTPDHLLPASSEEFVRNRIALEWEHLRTLETEKIPYWVLPYDLRTLEAKHGGSIYLSDLLKPWFSQSRSAAPQKNGIDEVAGSKAPSERMP